MLAIFLAVVGAAHPNKRGPTRRFGIGLCRPGDPIELRRERDNKFDEFAIAVFGHDIQIGYVSSERAVLIAPILDRGREVSAIFQGETPYGCVIRAGFDGEAPALPAPRRQDGEDPSITADKDRGFWPDELPDDESA